MKETSEIIAQFGVCLILFLCINPVCLLFINDIELESCIVCSMFWIKLFYLAKLQLTLDFEIFSILMIQ